MQIKNVGGWIVRVPERDQENKFLERVKNVGGQLLNLRRQDHGTRGNNIDPANDDKQMTAEFKEKRADSFTKLDLSEKQKEVDEGNNAQAQILEYKNMDGIKEMRHLEEQQNSEGTVMVDDNTVFSDGTNAEGTYNPRNEEPTVEELKLIEEEENRERKMAKDAGDFYTDRGSMGERGKGHRLC
jgi:hypothetical protein